MQQDKKYMWYKIAASENELDFKPNNLLEIEVAGKKVCIAKGKKLFACAAKCPHASGIIADGFIDAHDNVTCPLHRYKFDLHNGRNISGEGYYLKTYPIEIRNEGIFLGIEESGLFSWIK